MARELLIAGNWKMNMTRSESKEFASQLKGLFAKKSFDGINCAVIAPYTDLDVIKAEFAGSDVKVGAENVHFEDSGAFTGEVSLPMLKELGMDYIIIGHSERRQYFAETDETCCKKLKKIFADSDIIPILCVGENLEQRESGQEKAIVEGQLKKDLDGVAAEDAAKMVIAYEPIWAIGTGKTATPEQAEDMCGEIRRIIAGLYDSSVAEKITIQYGGSVKPENAKEILGKEDIDGALVGGASLKADKFYAIFEAAAE
ncbi:MAG: triose-phosphate isomerase [Anaerovoracaceae bacterium]|jgi:triosephosphate isomerase